MEKIRVQLTLTEGMLGTAPSSEEIYRDVINAPTEDAMDEETGALPEGQEQRGRTVFPRMEDGTPFVWDYQIKGFFKDACSMLSRLAKSGAGNYASGKIKAYKKVIDGLIFPMPRRIPIVFEGEITDCQRPLRAMTMRGERVTLLASEEVPSGATMEFDILCMDEALLPAVREWLDYGALRGLGQWRNSGKGRFTWEELV